MVLSTLILKDVDGEDRLFLRVCSFAKLKKCWVLQGRVTRGYKTFILGHIFAFEVFCLIQALVQISSNKVPSL